MSIKIDWTSMGGVPDSLTLYWANSSFTPETLPGTKFTLDPAALSYTDTTVPVNTVRYYMLEAIKAGENTQYSQCLVYGNYPKTGPGGSEVLRGNWDAGFMGVVPVANMISISGLRAAIGATTGNMGAAPADSTVTAWLKFIYKGKIIFIPNAPCSPTLTVNWPMLYNMGLVYGVDGPGAAPFDLTTAGATPAISTTVNQKKVVTIGTDDFLVRVPKLSTLPTNQNVPDDTSLRGGEWRETMGNMSTFIGSSAGPYLSPFRWGDMTPSGLYSLAATQHFRGTNLIAVNNVNWVDSYLRPINSAVSASWVNWVPVLEYIPV